MCLLIFILGEVQGRRLCTNLTFCSLSLMTLLQYTDLSTRTTSMDNGGDATIERRPGSGAYDHFTDS